MSNMIKRKQLSFYRLPFDMKGTREVVYIENVYDEAMNDFIQKNLLEIKNTFYGSGLIFRYLPQLTEQVLNESYWKDILHHPTLDIDHQHLPQSSSLLNLLVDSSERYNIKPSLAFSEGKRFKCGNKDGSSKNIQGYMTVMELSSTPSLENFKELAYEISEILEIAPSSPTFRYGRCTLEEINRAFQMTIRQIKMLEKALERSGRNGLTKDLVDTILWENYPTLPIVIDANGEITIGDDHPSFTVTQKTIYVFFLMHPEGVYHNQINEGKYKDELNALYELFHDKENQKRKAAGQRRSRHEHDLDKKWDSYATGNALNNTLSDITKALYIALGEDLLDAQEYSIVCLDQNQTEGYRFGMRKQDLDICNQCQQISDIFNHGSI